MKITIVGGGWAGCAAAISAKKAGADVDLFEKTDLLLGLGNVGGIMRNNGRYTASEELICLGGGDLIGLIVNLNDYNVGADKGGAVNMFDDFDIDYNQQKYLIETRCSGALTKPYSAIALELEVAAG